jgi:uncharacterized protein (TIGR02996 family)
MAHPSGDELALLKAVASAPDDDLPRLVYADWLEERGRGERGEFIRLQVADQQPMTGTERAAVRGRMEELLDAHRDAWFRELPRWVRQWYAGRPFERLRYHRGFVEQVGVVASHFLRFGSQLLDRTPVVRLDVYELGGVRRGLAGCPWLGRVPVLNLASERLGIEGAAALARNRHLGGVRELDLYGCGLTDGGVRALADAESLTGLTKLDLGGNDLTVAAVKALRGANFHRTLERVNLAGNPQLRGHEDRIRGWLGGRVIL